MSRLGITKELNRQRIARYLGSEWRVQQTFLETGRRLPTLWQSPALGAERKKALLRCLIDKVVAHRCAPDRIAVRIV
jgi:hypothetical protein